MKARYKYRIYPNHIQITKLNQLFGCCRYVWNSTLAYCNQLYSDGQKKPDYVDLTKQFITQAKRELIWLKEVASTPLQQSLKDLDQAYRNFFDSCTGKRKGIKVKPPKFKSKKSRQTARFVGKNYQVSQDKIYLPKVGKIKIVWSRPLASQPSSVTIIKDSAGRYFASFVVDTCVEYLPESENSIGIDLGISTFATLSDGQKIDAPKPLKKNLKKLGKFQRKLAQTELGSKRREKAQVRVAKLHAKVKDIRTDFLHKLSTDLVRKYDVIVLEDLNVSGMIKNRKLAKAISDLGWRQFRTLTETKCEKYGREFRVISRWEPTSQKCSHCGFQGGKKELNVSCGMLRKREWTCLNCGAFHDRDINAAVNILNTQSALETVNQPITKVETVKATVAKNPIQLSLFNKVAEGQTETIKRTRRKRQTGKLADSNDVSTRPESFLQLSLFD
ncbi:MAG: IS200/IS605 family element transposase accessory protein TnpB [Okeania sp. SIO3B5]|uniref:RNA-guided endonuclease InsQ/TnpB family protein n=1 Tax=Okeania sp. SIO3B5 TaxID=2607811 RepID=UPI0014002EF1|nr:RNA-guided endonuclease TnpB family protein [Okeania sp. SIO3B5]NEO54884.1 IS200/IS605 family element transposase accessory protein TnpB [Okeania sp. SIO3B5]